MPRLTYIGSHDSVDVPAAGVSCKHGESVNVPADLAKSLLEQADNWKPAKAAEKKETAK